MAVANSPQVGRRNYNYYKECAERISRTFNIETENSFGTDWTRPTNVPNKNIFYIANITSHNRNELKWVVEAINGYSFTMRGKVRTFNASVTASNNLSITCL